MWGAVAANDQISCLAMWRRGFRSEQERCVFVTTIAIPDKSQSPILEPDLVADARIVLADLDGCLMSGGKAFEDAADFVAACGERLWIVSNNSTHTARALAATLSDAGLDVDPGRILLAGEQTLLHLAQTCPERTLALFAGEVLQQEARALGLRVSRRRVDQVLLCRDLSFAIPDLERLADLIRGGARLWVSNTDVAHPSPEGKPVPETGALLAALHAVVGRVAYDCIGKPDPHMADLVTKRTSIAATEAIFVGDNTETDGALALSAGMPFLQIVREAKA